MSILKETALLQLVFPLTDMAMGTCAMKWYKQIKKMSKWSKAEVESWQNVELTKLICHAYYNTVFYRKQFDSLGLKPEDIKTKEDLIKLPVINKEIINAHYDEFIPQNIQRYKYRESRTGGTTGEPMRYLCDENTWGYVTAAKIFYWKKTGYRYGDPFVALGSASLFPEKKDIVRELYDKMRSEVGLNGMNLSDEVCAKYVQLIKKKNVHYIYGYAASVYLLARYVHNHGVEMPYIKYVYTTSEKLTDEYRMIIEEAFHCHVMDCYGARDAGITAFQIDNAIYPIGYNVIVETLNQTKADFGPLLTTNILNYAFPLIRYEFGDEVILENNSKEYNGQIISQIIGRSSDIMKLGNGNMITGPGFTILIKPFDIKEYMVRQLTLLEVELLIVPLEGYSIEQEHSLVAKIKGLIGDDCELRITHVDKIEPLKNGKRTYLMVN